MERLLTIIATVVALCVAMLLPTVGTLVHLRSERAILQSEAEINARLTSQLISQNPELWEVLTTRHEELLRRRPQDGTPEARTLTNLKGEVVARSADDLQPPVVEQRMPVYDAGRQVGELQVQRSLRPLLLHLIVMSLVGLLPAAAVFITLRTLPLRALRRSQDRLRHEATHDALTGLPNRTLLQDRLQLAIVRAHRTSRPFALVFIDLDRFKDINDALGHATGDQVLQHTATLITQCLQEGWSEGQRISDGEFTLARMGGDEFVVLLESVGSVADVSTLIERMQGQLAQPVSLCGHTVHTHSSIGVALFPQDGESAEQLLQHADLAMYRAKEHGRGTYRYFSQDLSTETQRRIALNEAMRGALERHEFELHYQPKADLRTGEVRGVEALLRWRRPTGGLVPPAEFIDSLENSRLILPVGAWVIETACAQLLAWDRQGLPPLSMAVNVSPRQFHDPALIHVVEQALQRTGLDPQRLELEVTESLVMDNQAESAATLARLSALGVRLAIDDFGTGYSSLAYLKQFPVDTLKLDRSFVSGLPGQRDCVAITAAVQVLAQHMQMQVVCEGVETADQRDHLRSQGFELMQGFLLARPMPAEAFLPWWLQQRPQPQRQSPQAPAAAAPAMATVTAKDPVET